MTLAISMPAEVGKTCTTTNYKHTSVAIEPLALDLIYNDFPDAS